MVYEDFSVPGAKRTSFYLFSGTNLRPQTGKLKIKYIFNGRVFIAKCFMETTRRKFILFD